MLSRIENTFGKRKQLRLQDDHGSRGDWMSSTAILIPSSKHGTSINTIGNSGTVVNVTGDFNVYNGESATADTIGPPPPAATSADLLASRILQTIGVTAAARENLITAMHLALKAVPPTLFVLDNFETTWEGERDHAATRNLLQKITDCPSSTLIITMRATSPPPGIQWTVAESLPPLPAPAAKQVFLAINATFCDGSDDGNEVLEELLEELDYVPLAIHLLAHVSMDLFPRQVLKHWQKQRTCMLSLDLHTKDKLESVEISISLSMESLDVDRNFEAIQLLGMLCLLPDGLLRWEGYLDVIEKAFPSATFDLFLL
ncbi:hypothetical protein FIBSPDRAFT_948413 [Athelia psychrophila]|uniref:NACHT domain-containing protein n=1 Tax=Athelia psychrophila TaxID=1759441 RepID=A0A166QS72_9AGAM|nr:hypothetical protein FIBSPDRAFT_948413 [Fibularhizoctonia sp. CBS 109695]